MILRITRTLLLAAALAAAPARALAQPADSAALVVLVHGMGRTPLSMLPMERALERSGYRVLNFGYSSYGPDVAEIADRLARRLASELDERPAARVHFVGHSLGTIVVRRMLLAHVPDAEVGRVVMLAPPNRGSRDADRWAPIVGWLLPPIRELRTRGSTVAGMPPPVGMEFAIVAGSRDGKVRVAETCLSGAAAHAIVPSTHTFILMHPRTFRLVRQFLATGEFEEAVRVPARAVGGAPAAEVGD